MYRQSGLDYSGHSKFVSAAALSCTELGRKVNEIIRRNKSVGSIRVERDWKWEWPWQGHNTSDKCVIVMIIATASRPAATLVAARRQIEYHSQFAQQCESKPGVLEVR